MIQWKRAAVLGFLSWLIPFMMAFPLFPLKQANGPLFDTVMTLVVLLTAASLLPIYFKNRAVTMPEALATGALWFALNLAFDYPMFSHGPMKMTAAAYYSEIGLGYLIFPVFAFGA